MDREKYTLAPGVGRRPGLMLQQGLLACSRHPDAKGSVFAEMFKDSLGLILSQAKEDLDATEVFPQGMRNHT